MHLQSIYITTMSLLRSQLLRTALRPRAVQVSWSRAASSSVPEPQNPLQPFQPDESTPKASQQSPNVPTTWSTSQNPKPHVQNNARYIPSILHEDGRANDRFEQTNLDLQPNAPSAMGMVAEDPIRLVDGRRASCDGGKLCSPLA